MLKRFIATAALSLLSLSSTVAVFAQGSTNLLDEGGKLYSEEHYKEAAEKLLKADLEVPGDYYTQLMLGATFACMQDGKHAIDYFHRAVLFSDLGSQNQGYALDGPYDFGLVSEKPKHNVVLVPTRNDMGHRYMSAGSYSAALNEFSEEFKHDPRDGALAYQIGVTYVKLEDVPSALQWFTKSADLCEKSHDYRFLEIALLAPKEFGLVLGNPVPHPDPYRPKRISFSYRGLPQPPRSYPPL